MEGAQRLFLTQYIVGYIAESTSPFGKVFDLPTVQVASTSPIPYLVSEDNQ